MRVSPCLTAFFLACASLPLGAQQGFYREYYAGIAGSRVADLTAAAAFPDAPTVEEVVNSPLETGVNVADYYGQRVRALLTPSVTGAYTFWVATDDGGELWLGTDHTAASRRRIAYVSGWTNSREWTRELNQKSAPIALTAGTRYYIEVLQKENTGGDNLAVAWQVPGTTATNVIPAAVLTPYLDPPVIRTQPISLDIEEQWAGQRSVTFTVAAVRQGGVTYQWQRDGVNLPGATASVYTLTADFANSNRLFRCVLSNLAGTVTSAAARYRFVPDVTAPALTAWSVFHDRRILTLAFSEPLDPASATNPAAYAVSGRAVLDATLLEDGAGVALHLDTALTAGAVHTLALTVQDRAVPANTLALTGFSFVPPLNAPVPAALVRGGREPAGPSSRRTAIAITEISHTPASRSDGRDLRFVELYNSNPFYQDLSGYRLSGVFDYTLPTGTVLAANGYLVVAPSPADVTAVTGLQQVVGGFEAYAFDGSGEITLHDALGAWLSTVTYGDDPPWPVAADGSGHTLVLARPSYGERDADGWSASALPGGSPGAADPARPATFEAVLINEVLAHSGATPGFIELHNLADTPRALGGCVLKRDDLGAPGYLIPDGTELPARGFLAFHEAALGFLIDGSGDTVWLFAPAAAGGHVIDALRLDDQQIGVAHGRFPDGDARWNILETPTPGAANTPRRPAPVVLNEIMYNPISEDKDEEYVELFNPGAQSVNLDGWKLGGGIDYAFGPRSIPAGGYLVVPRDPAAFARLYPDRTALATPDGFSGSLANSRETVTLSQPVPVMDTADPLAPVVVTNNTVVERVTYRDGGEWHALADGGGSSLERIDPRADPALARSWDASDESQKSAWTTL
ncbi:MAG: lamin tail domain-containing protein, partial [Kiritimatiellae bacterium]|nr:lamin tail domain-containing protein [Kiritimatiellia bacterium]